MIQNTQIEIQLKKKKICFNPHPLFGITPIRGFIHDKKKVTKCNTKLSYFNIKKNVYASNDSIYSPLIKFAIPDFLNIQRASFRYFLKYGLIEEFRKYNCIKNSDQTLEVFFYAEHYKLNRPKWTPKQAILKRKSYACQLFLPIQLSNHKTEEVQLQWVLLANLPLMTKHGHFIFNGCPRVLMNQMVRSPGVYFKKLVSLNKKTVYCADFIAQRGSWLRLQVDTQKGDIWAKLKKTPKIPIFIFLRALGISLPVLNNSLDYRKFCYISQLQNEMKKSIKIHRFLSSGTTRINNSQDITQLQTLEKSLKQYMIPRTPKKRDKRGTVKTRKRRGWPTNLFETDFTALLELFKQLSPNQRFYEEKPELIEPKLAQKFLFRKFLNPRTYDLSLLGRSKINKKLGLSIPLDHTQLTGQDVLVACLFLMNLLQGLVLADDIDDLSNRKIQPSGDLLKTQLAIGLIRLDKVTREKLNQPNIEPAFFTNLFSIKPINQSFREFFGTSPLSQLMDQTNALAELTHKRRLSSLGPGGINRENAGMSIRGIHPTHYGRICPIETPEGQNAGLVNSFTTYSNLNPKGFIETPFYKTYKGFILKNNDPLLFSSDQESQWVLAPGDISLSTFSVLRKGLLPARQLKEFKRVSRNAIHFTAMSPIQMISVATSLIPFLEHDDGNRALMGSNMQRQSIPTLRPSKPIVATGLESRVISDVGHGLQVKNSGFVSSVDGKEIIIYSLGNGKPPSLVHKNLIEKDYLQQKMTTRFLFKEQLVKTSKKSVLGASCFKTKNSGKVLKSVLFDSVYNKSKSIQPFFRGGSTRIASAMQKKNKTHLDCQYKQLGKKGNLLKPQTHLNIAQLFFFQTRLFLNDFLGHFFLLTGFQNTSRKKKLFTRSFFLMNQFSHQQFLLTYCKKLLFPVTKNFPLKTLGANNNPLGKRSSPFCFGGTPLAFALKVTVGEKLLVPVGEKFPLAPLAFALHRRCKVQLFPTLHLRLLKAGKAELLPRILFPSGKKLAFLLAKKFGQRSEAYPPFTVGERSLLFPFGEKQKFLGKGFHLRRKLLRYRRGPRVAKQLAPTVFEGATRGPLRLLPFTLHLRCKARAFTFGESCFATEGETFPYFFASKKATFKNFCLSGKSSAFPVGKSFPEGKRVGGKSWLPTGALGGKAESPSVILARGPQAEALEHGGEAIVPNISAEIPMPVFLNTNLASQKYSLNNYHRSNQDTYMIHRPIVQEGQWVEKGDVLADSSASVQGELAIGQNILVGYTPWEGYNFEDAVLISERVVYDDLYTSLHIERYEVEVRDTPFGLEQITNQLNVALGPCSYLDANGIAKIGTWVKEGDILVGKIAPTGQKNVNPHEKLLYAILGKEPPKTRDTSLRVPRGVNGRVVHIEIVDKDTKKKGSKIKKGLKIKKGPLKKVKKYAPLTCVPFSLSKSNDTTRTSILIQNVKNRPTQTEKKHDLILQRPLPERPHRGLSSKLETFGSEATCTFGFQRPKVQVASLPKVSSFDLAPTAFALHRRCKVRLFPTLHLRLLKAGKAELWVPFGQRSEADPPFTVGERSLLFPYGKSWPPTGALEQKFLGKSLHLRCKLLRYQRCNGKSSVFKNVKHPTRINIKSLPNNSNLFLNSPNEEKKKFLKTKETNKMHFLTFNFSENAKEKWKKNSKIHESVLERKIAQLRNWHFSFTISQIQKTRRLWFEKAKLAKNCRQLSLFKPRSYSRPKGFIDFDIASLKSVLFGPFFSNQKLRLKKETPRSFKKATQAKTVFPSQEKNFLAPVKVYIYLAEKRKLQVGDKIAGRHGNKGIVSNILPRQDMPYISDGTPLDIVLNPLGVPSRMNVGQIFECLLGLAGYYLNQNYKIQPFDEIYGSEASRSLVYSKLYEARIKTGQDWLFNPNFPGKTRLFDGRSGDCFEQPVTVGIAYILKLIHLVDDKIHARSTGPYSLVTQQPLRGRAKQGGQRVGEMEVWALEGFGAAYILQEILTVKSDDLHGRKLVMDCILKNQPMRFSLPESFKLLVCELRSLCLNMVVYKETALTDDFPIIEEPPKLPTLNKKTTALNGADLAQRKSEKTTIKRRTRLTEIDISTF